MSRNTWTPSAEVKGQNQTFNSSFGAEEEMNSHFKTETYNRNRKPEHHHTSVSEKLPGELNSGKCSILKVFHDTVYKVTFFCGKAASCIKQVCLASKVVCTDMFSIF